MLVGPRGIGRCRRPVVSDDCARGIAGGVRGRWAHGLDYPLEGLCSTGQSMTGVSDDHRLLGEKSMVVRGARSRSVPGGRHVGASVVIATPDYAALAGRAFAWVADGGQYGRFCWVAWAQLAPHPYTAARRPRSSRFRAFVDHRDGMPTWLGLRAWGVWLRSNGQAALQRRVCVIGGVADGTMAMFWLSASMSVQGGVFMPGS